MLTDSAFPDIPQEIRRTYPFHTRTVEIEGQRMSFVDEGGADAPPLLLLHGNATWSFLYRKVIPKLSERFRVIAPDLIGFGLSDKPEHPSYHSLQRHSSNVAALMEALGFQKYTLVANELGGPIGLAFALRKPENLERLVLMNTWASLPEGHVQWQLSPALRAARGKLAPAISNVPLRIVKEGSSRALAAEALAGYKFPLRSKAGQAASLELSRQWATRAIDAGARQMTDIQQSLGRFQCRVEILWGSSDPLFSGKMWPFLLRDAFPNASEPELLTNVGRLVPEDAPEKLIDKLLEIFKPKPVVTKPALNILQ